MTFTRSSGIQYLDVMRHLSDSEWVIYSVALLTSQRPMMREYIRVGNMDSSRGSTTSWNSMMIFAPVEMAFIKAMRICIWATEDVHHCRMSTSGRSLFRNL